MLRRSHASKFALGILAAITLSVWGCGGGGGGSNGGGGGGGGLSGNITVESSLAGGTVIDPLNIQAGESATFFLAAYDASGTRTTAQVTGWTSTDTSHAAGTLNGDGTFTAAATANSNTFLAKVTYNGTTYSIPYRVNAKQARLSGKVIDQRTGAGIRNIKLVFYNGSGVLVGSARASFSGAILASVPANTARFNIDPNSIDTSLYYSTFTYNGLRFSPLITTCTAALPGGLTNGTTTPLASNVVLTSSTDVPPPPPTGCQ